MVSLKIEDIEMDRPLRMFLIAGVLMLALLAALVGSVSTDPMGVPKRAVEAPVATRF